MKELARKHHRQQALLHIVQAQKLATQQDLVRALKAAGFAATQATISRDIVELGLVKVARDGQHVYAAPTAVASGGGTDRLRRFCEDYPVEGRLAGNIPVDCGIGCAACGKDCRVSVLLRPDDVVHDDASATQAEVVAKAFRGAEFLYTLKLSSGVRVLSLVPSHHNHAIGEKIGIRLDVDHVVVFRNAQ